MDQPTAHDPEETQDPVHSDEQGSEKSSATDTPDVPAPFAPDSDEDSALGDTDEHSDA